MAETTLYRRSSTPPGNTNSIQVTPFQTPERLCRSAYRGIDYPSINTPYRGIDYPSINTPFFLLDIKTMQLCKRPKQYFLIRRQLIRHKKIRGFFSDVKSGVTALISVRRVDVALQQKNATQGIYGRTVGAEKEEGNKAGCNLTFHTVNYCWLVFLFLPVFLDSLG